MELFALNRKQGRPLLLAIRHDRRGPSEAQQRIVITTYNK